MPSNLWNSRSRDLIHFDTANLMTICFRNKLCIIWQWLNWLKESDKNVNRLKKKTCNTKSQLVMLFYSRFQRLNCMYFESFTSSFDWNVQFSYIWLYYVTLYNKIYAWRVCYAKLFTLLKIQFIVKPFLYLIRDIKW